MYLFPLRCFPKFRLKHRRNERGVAMYKAEMAKRGVGGAGGASSVPSAAVATEDGVAVVVDEWDQDSTVLDRVARRGTDLQFASERLKASFDLVLAAVQENGMALRYAAADMVKHYELVMDAVRQNGDALQFASEALRSDKRIAIAAVRSLPCALKHCAPVMRNDKEVVETAVAEDGCALEWASESLKADRDVVLLALRGKSEPKNVVYANLSLTTSKSFQAAYQKENAGVIAEREREETEERETEQQRRREARDRAVIMTVAG